MIYNTKLSCEKKKKKVTHFVVVYPDGQLNSITIASSVPLFKGKG